MWRRTGPVLWSLYVLWRAPEWGLLHGIPLTAATSIVLFAVWWAWWVGGTLPGRAWLLPLLLAKMLCGPLLVPRGLHASYYTNASWQGSPERGLFGRWPSETRTDSSLAFGNGAPDFPLFFLNELRHNHSGVTTEPLSAVWTGQLVVADDHADLNLYLSGNDIAAETLIDGFRVVGLTPGEHEATGRVRARSGLRHLSVSLSSPSGIPRAFEAGVMDSVSGRRRPFGRADVLLEPVSPARLQFDRAAKVITQLADGAALAALAFAAFIGLRTMVRTSRIAGWRQIVVPAGSILAFGEALFLARHAEGRFQLLAWGSDRLTYESFSRDILFHGPLMTLGAPLGHGDAFYYQPLYPYFLSAVHVLAGEGFWGVYLFQRLGFALTFYAFWSIADLLFDRSTEVVALVLAYWFAYVYLYDFSAAMYNESLFIPLLSLWTLWLCREAVSPGSRNVAAGAAIGGLATLTRSTLVAAWPLVVVVLAVAYKRQGRSMGRLMAFPAILAAVVGLATIRNAVVAHQFVPITTGLSQNLRDGNVPSDAVVRDNRDHPWTAWIARDERTRSVLGYAYDQPGPFLQGLWTKATYVLGMEKLVGARRPSAFSTTDDINRMLPWIWVSALVGGAVLLASGSRRRQGRSALLIPVAIAVSQFAAVVLILPYSERLVLPFYTPLLPYAAVPIGALANLIGIGTPRGQVIR